MSDRARLITLLLERSVERGEFVLASGQRSTYYIDARRTTMSAEGLALIGRLGLTAIQEAQWNPVAVGGLTLGADPVAYAIAQASAGLPRPINAFTIRKAPKAHGTGREVEGNLEPGQQVVVVEDVLTSGQSAERAIGIAEAHGASVVGVLVVVDREEGGRARLEARGSKVVALTTTSDLGLRTPPGSVPDRRP